MGRHETICERKRAKTLVFRVSEGQRRGVSPFRRLAAFRRSWCFGASNEKGQRRKKEGVTRNHGFPSRIRGVTAKAAGRLHFPASSRLFSFRSSQNAKMTVLDPSRRALPAF